MSDLRIIKTKSLVKIRWRTRLKIWWNVRKIPRELRRALDEEIDKLMLHGDDEWTVYHEFRSRTDPPPWGRGEDS